ncbi:merozoite surface protein 5 [Plasmodium ovale wallikeri]|uniref:Merozoite surface protein 5 n=1 Tax=Plasmodium ovale wallikeri TaxID=864142 RepID=A0A1A9ALL2_PLAOA|nr:merozoite surface protein 5 [Plasmodium ovale wallikeri]SBT56965.1 merozoite surface protein 5 [Plasmodium ovale wallikeri]
MDASLQHIARLPMRMSIYMCICTYLSPSPLPTIAWVPLFSLTDKLDDKVAHYSALRNNRIEKDVTDTMVLSDIIGNENMKSCSQNNGGCADDQICIRIDKIGIKCICKEGHLFGGKCILANSSALYPLISISIPFLMALLLTL